MRCSPVAVPLRLQSNCSGTRRGAPQAFLYPSTSTFLSEAGAPAPFNPGMRPVLRALQTAPGSYRRDANHPDEWFCGHDRVRLPAYIPERLEPTTPRTYGPTCG